MAGDDDSMGRGLALLELGRASEAEWVIRAELLVRTQPHGDRSDEPNTPDIDRRPEADLLAVLADALVRQHRFDEAYDAARAALDLDPDHVGAMRMGAVALLHLADPDAAQALVNRAIALMPELDDLHVQQAVIHAWAGRFTLALESVLEARRLDPDDPVAAALHADALFDLGRYDEAESVALEAVDLDPDQSSTHDLLADLARRRGDRRAAVARSRESVRLDPTDPDQRHRLATHLKVRNPLYGALLTVQDRLASLPTAARLFATASPALLAQVLRPYADQPWAWPVVGALLGVVLLSWMFEPLMNAILLPSAYARGLMPASMKRATVAFLGYVAACGAAIVVVVAVGFSAGWAWLLVAGGLLIWSGSAGQLHLVAHSRQRVARAIQVAGLVVAVAAVVAVGTGLAVALPILIILIVGGLAALWFTAVS